MKIGLHFYALILICFLSIKCFAQVVSPIDSAKKHITSITTENEFINTCFFIADNYMNVEQYDSAQIWLNKIHEKLPVKTNSLNNYFLITRQAEVYYYNNLQQLGLQESLRGLEMAKALKDSLLLADSYNFLGLFLMNMDSAAQAIPYYTKGLPYTKQPPFPFSYLSLSKPHHLYGNMAEAYFKLKDYKNASLNYSISLQKATDIQWQRGIAVANFGLGEVYATTLVFDSAIFFYNNAKQTAINANDLDVALVSYGGLGKSYFGKKQIQKANEYLIKGMQLLQTNANLNRFYALTFLNTAYEIFKKQNNANAIVAILELKSTIEKSNIDGNNRQIQTILNAGVANEKKVLSLQVAEAKRKQQLANARLLMALGGIVLLGVLFLIYRYYQKQKQEVYKIRQEISKDLHDDIGASLSSLQIYSTIAEKTFQSNPEKAVEMLQKIATQSKQVMENMNDIIWSMRSEEDVVLTLDAKIKNYSTELLSDNNINFSCTVDSAVEQALKNITAKRNILLIIREALHNISKYSKATNAALAASLINKTLQLTIKDDGVGFDYEHRKYGNGLGNMKKRVEELRGSFSLTTSINEGTNITVLIPVKSL